MKKHVMIGLLAAIAVIALAGCGGNGTSSKMSAGLLKSCSGRFNISGGGAIAKVSGNQCVVSDHGATVVASGDSIVSAHGDSTVVASGSATVVVYNQAVQCDIKSATVTVVNSVRTPGGFPGLMSPSCRVVLTP